MLLPVFDKRSLWDIITAKEKQADPLTAKWSDGDWFYETRAGGYGSMPKVEINYTRFWSDMRNHVKWSLSYLSNVGGAWVDVSNQMNVNVVSNAGNYEKFSLNFIPQQTGTHKLQLVVDWNAINWTYNPVKYEYRLMYKTDRYNWIFNYSYIDICNVLGLKFDRYIDARGRFIFNITKNIVISDTNRPINLDPSYGLADVVISSYEYDTQEGRNTGLNGACRINESEYYLIAASGDTGSDGDGFLRTLHVWNDNGTIEQAVIDKWEYLDSDVGYCNVKHIPGTDKYVVAYRDEDIAAKVTLMTVRVWDNNGTIDKTAIDTQALTQDGIYIYLHSFTDNIWIVGYTEATSSDGFIETVWIDFTGIINNSLLDIEEFDETYGYAPVICNVDSDTIAMTYKSGSSTGDWTLKTYNISGAGLITDTYSDTWNYEASPNSVTPNGYINKIGSTTYELVYINADSTPDLYAKTVTIDNAGMITESFIDTLIVYNGVYGGVIGNIVEVFVVHDPLANAFGKGIFGVTCKGATLSQYGQLYTWNVSSDGILGDARIDSLQYSGAGVAVSDYAHVEYVNHSFYLIIYTLTDADGWSKTITINTNWAIPTVSNPVPANHSSNIALTPICSITVNDKDGFSTMDVTFAENSTGSWINRQTNKSCVNGTYEWIHAQATENSHNYYWRVFVNDSMYNMSFTYNFTTLEANIPPTIELSHPYPNGTDHVEINPVCAVWTNDSNLQAMDITWKNSSDGITWYTRQINSSVASGTLVTWDSNGIFSEWGTTYYFQVYADDGEDNISEWFTFTTIGNLASPTVSNVYPANHSTSIPVTPQMHIDATDLDGNELDITWLSNSSTPDTLILRPEANGSSIHLTRSAENANYKCVDETVANDADYVYTTNQVTYINDTYTMQNQTSTNNITSVNVHIRAGYDATGINVFITACTAKITLRVNGVYYYGSEITLTTSFADYNYSWSTNPNTGLTWTWTDINNMQVGVSLKGRVKATTHSKCSYLYEEITFVNHSNWAVFGTNNSVYNGTYYQTNSNFSDLDTTYYWQLHVFDGLHWNNYSYDFTTGINTNVDVISPYEQTISPVEITATGTADLDNVTLWYRWNTSFPNFKHLSTKDDGSTYRNVWSDGTYVYVACEADGLRAYTFDGTNFVLKEQVLGGITYFDVWGDGTYIYTACSDDGIRALTFDGNVFTLIDTQDDDGIYTGVWGDGTYIYVTCYDDGLRVYTFYNGNFVLKDTQDDGGSYIDVWEDGNYIYTVCNSDGIYAYSFDGSSLALLDTQNDGGSYSAIWGNDTYIYVTCGVDGIRAYTFDGANFVLKDTKDDGGTYDGIYGYGNYIYAACFDDGIRAYVFDGSNFILLDTDYQGVGGFNYGIWCDDSYIFNAYSDGGVLAYDFGVNGTWYNWSDASNPDDVYPWNWSFNFPNGTGYYEFYSIGNKTGAINESAPLLADAACSYSIELPNNPPVLTNPDPANNSINIPITQGTLTVTIEDPDGDTFAYYWSCSDGSSNSAIGNTNGSKILMLNPGDLDYGTLYTWWVNVTDGEDWTNVTYFFTTEASPKTRAKTQVFDYWLLCGNESSRVKTQAFYYWLLCGNESYRSKTNVFDYWLYCGNESNRQQTTIFDYWLLCGNESGRIKTSVFDRWILCGNESEQIKINVFNKWLLCGNESSIIKTQVIDKWLYCGNESGRTKTKVFDKWLLCGNESSITKTKVFDKWLYCGNESILNKTNVFDYWLLCGNESGRIKTGVFDRWILCGNESSRIKTQVFNKWLYCGNESQPLIKTKVFDKWLLCGNESYKSKTEIFNYWLYCGNETIALPGNITLSNEIPVNNSIITVTSIFNKTTGITLSITRHHSNGSNMNTSFYFNGTYLYTNYNFGNGTVSFYLYAYWNDSLRDEHTYNWSVNCTDGYNYINETYNFSVETIEIGFLLVTKKDNVSMLCLVLLSSIIFCAIAKRRKRKIKERTQL